MYETILFATDGTDHANAVATHAIDIANQRDASLHVLSVVDDRAFLMLEDDRVTEVRADLERGARAAVKEATDLAAGHGVETTGAVETGHPADRILEYVEANGVTLIVMGTSGDNYERNVVGSISQRVVQQSPVPVLTVGPDA